MNFNDFSKPKPVFDESAIKAVLAETGLPLAPGMTIREFWESREDFARCVEECAALAGRDITATVNAEGTEVTTTER